VTSQSSDANSASPANEAPEQTFDMQPDDLNVADSSVPAGQIDEPDPWHREMDRVVDQWDDEPTHEKWRRGGKGWR
jgi:hypothetical protein